MIILTYIVVFSAWSELETQRERGEELKLLRELERPVGRVGPIALPAFEARRCVVTRAVAVVVDHVQHVALGPLLRHGVHVVWTVDIQVVVDAHVKVVVTSVKSVKSIKKDIDLMSLARRPRENDISYIKVHTYHEGI